MALKIAAVLFSLFGLRRIVARYRKGGALTLELLTWLALWTGIAVVVFIPQKTDVLARYLGVSSGFNALTFLSIAGLLFAVYQLFTRLQTVERELTELVRAQALSQPLRVARRGEAGGRPRPASSDSPPSAA